MATEQTTKLPVQAWRPYAGVPSIAQTQTFVPRGHLDLTVLAGAIDAPGASTNQLLRINATLPVNYAYAIVDISFAITGLSGASNLWDPSASLSFADGNSVTRTFSAMSEMVNSNVMVNGGGALPARVYFPHNLSNMVIRPAEPGQGVVIDIWCQNDTDNDIGYTLDFYCKVLQFSLQQSFEYPVNSPMPVR